ncbi:TIGR02611 family protein, partial [Streptomyces globisporus]
MNAESDERNRVAEEAPPASATGESDREERELGSRAPGFIKASKALHLSWQVGVFVVGLGVVVAGVLMLVLPGPGWLVIFAGMAIWATEFVWAQLVLRWTKRKVTEAAQRALDPKVRRPTHLPYERTRPDGPLRTRPRGPGHRQGRRR